MWCSFPEFEYSKKLPAIVFWNCSGEYVNCVGQRWSNIFALAELGTILLMTFEQHLLVFIFYMFCNENNNLGNETMIWLLSCFQIFTYNFAERCSSQLLWKYNKNDYRKRIFLNSNYHDSFLNKKLTFKDFNSPLSISIVHIFVIRMFYGIA